MCGIVGGIAERDVAKILLEGLRRLEYRGYDSAGIAVINGERGIKRERAQGKVKDLEQLLRQDWPRGHLGIAHTRWATHGEPSTRNAHPHICRGRVAIVHNGIIENHEALRAAQAAAGHQFTSETDTEVIVHAIFDQLDQGCDLLEAVRNTVAQLQGAYALGVIDIQDPNRLIAARHGSPLVVGVGFDEAFIASDVFALLPVTQRFMFLEDGDIADLTGERIEVYDHTGQRVEREIKLATTRAEAADRGGYRHYMQKEIFEQPRAIADTLEGRLVGTSVLPDCLGSEAEAILERVRAVQIVACGTSYHAGLVARYWCESLAGIPCNVEVASEFRYRKLVVAPDTLFITISQSGETADTLAALKQAKALGYVQTLSICNVAESSLVRESGLSLLTHAGPEIGVASTKAFTTQLVALLMLVTALGRCHGMSKQVEADLVNELRILPGEIEKALQLDDEIKRLAQRFAETRNTLFLGRGEEYPVALEGALKLKEISYIHAEAYAAGELKHGPLALIDADMPVIAVAPDNALLEKLKSNLEEVRARGGELIVFADESAAMGESPDITIIKVPKTPAHVAPIVFSVPLQLLAYHVAVLKGTDVDQPRNLAKSVTVE